MPWDLSGHPWMCTATCIGSHARSHLQRCVLLDLPLLLRHFLLCSFIFFYLFGSPFQHKTSKANSSWFFKTIVLLLASSLHPDHPPLCLHLPHPSLLSWLDIPTIFWDLVWPSKCKVYQSMNTKFSQATWESSANLVPCLAKAQKQRKSLGRHAGIVGLVPQWRGSSFQALHLQQHSSPTAWCARCQGDGCQSRKRWVSPGARVHSLQRRSKLLHQLQLLLWR